MTDRALDRSPRALRKFGLLFGSLALLWGAYLLLRGHTSPTGIFGLALALAALFFGLGLFLPHALGPLYWLWMKLAFVLAWLNTRLILGLFFYLILTPIGLILRLSGKDLLGLKISQELPSYWQRREPESFDPARCKRMF